MDVIKAINNVRDIRIQAAEDAKLAALNAGQTEIQAEKEFQETLIEINNQANTEIEIQEEQHAANIVAIDTDAQNKILENRQKKSNDYKNYLAQTLKEINKITQSFIDAEIQLAAQRTDRILKQLEREKQAKLKQIDFENKSVITQSDIRQAQIQKIEEEYAQKQRDIEAKQFEYEKQLKIAQTIMNGVVGASRIVAAQAANPVIMGISLAALAAATTAQVAVIEKQELPAFAEGGMVTGPGTGTSDSILARLSNGEFIVNAKATQQNLPLLQALNEGKTNNMMPNVDPELKQAIMQLNNNLSTPMKAYILQNDITNSVRAEQQLKSRRKL